MSAPATKGPSIQCRKRPRCSIFVRTAAAMFMCASDGSAFRCVTHLPRRTVRASTASTSSVGAAPPGWGAGDDWSLLSAASFSRPSSSDLSFPELPGLECAIDDPECLDDAYMGDLVASMAAGPATDVPLYDGLYSGTARPSAGDVEAAEVALLVRCNDVPAWADPLPPPPSEEEARAFDQLATVDADDVHGGCATTPFFESAVAALFAAHAAWIPRRGAAGAGNVRALRPREVAAWMERSLHAKVRVFDPRVQLTISRYATYGTGYLTQPQFRRIYVAAVQRGAAAAVRQDGNTRRAQAQDVFRDFHNHGIMSPVQRRWKDLEEEWERIRPHRENAVTMRDAATIVDECEILDWDTTETGKAISAAIWGDDAPKKKKSTTYAPRAQDTRDEESTLGGTPVSPRRIPAYFPTPTASHSALRLFPPRPLETGRRGGTGPLPDVGRGQSPSLGALGTPR